MFQVEIFIENFLIDLDLNLRHARTDIIKALGKLELVNLLV